MVYVSIIILIFTCGHSPATCGYMSIIIGVVIVVAVITCVIKIDGSVPIGIFWVQ